MGSKKLLTAKELMKKVKISRSSLWRYEQDGLPFIKVLNSKRYYLEEVEDWIKKKDNNPFPEGYLSSDEIQEMLSISRTTLHRLMKNGLPYEKEGKRLKFKEDEVQKWLKRDSFEEFQS